MADNDTNDGSRLKAIKLYFDCTLDELKALSDADKAELAPLCRAALAEQDDDSAA